jgi:hypothetical protein
MYNDIQDSIKKFTSGYRILEVKEVHGYINRAFVEKKKLALVRLGDGEALTLAQHKVLPYEDVIKNSFLRYAGVRIPDIKGRDALACSIKKSDIVGIPLNTMPNFLPLLLKAFKAHHIDPLSLNLTNACINYFLHDSVRLKQIVLEGSPSVIIIGNKGKELARILRENGVIVSSFIAPVNGLRDVDRVVKIAGRHRFDIALVAAGVAAVVICERIASSMNRIALDIGHVADKIVQKGCI